MNSNIFKTQISILLLFSFVFTACNGQLKTAEVTKNNLSKNQSVKIPKPQGIYTYAAIGVAIQDRKGNLWFGSNGEGVFKYDGKVFTHYTMNEGLNSNTTYAIVEDKVGTLWVGTNKGLNRFDRNKFEDIPMVLPNNLMSPNFSNNYLQTGNAVWSMMLDRKGILWLGTDEGVYCYNGTEFIRFVENQNIVNKDHLQLKAIFSILETKDGNIWFTACQSEGVSMFDGKTLSNMIPYQDVGRTDRVMEDTKGNLWFACVFKGVGRYASKIFTQNVFNEKPIHGPSNIIEDAKGNIWFDSQNGLSYYDGTNLKQITQSDQIALTNLVPIILDKDGHIWLSSKGMGLYQYENGKVLSYSE